MRHDPDIDPAAEIHSHHFCGNLFGCGEENGTGVFREDIKDAAFTARAADRLLHMDEFNQDQLDGFVSARGLSRRRLLRASSFMSLLAATGPWFTRLAHAADSLGTGGGGGSAGGGSKKKDDEGKVHIVESNDKTVQLGVYDTTLDPILKIDSGDTISYVNTWSHFLNQLQPGVPVETLAKLRLSNPGHGPHSIIGPIYVNNAEPGDVLEVRYKRIRPDKWGAVFNNPGSIGTGLLAKDFPDGQVKYLNLDMTKMTAEFSPDIHVPLQPFQGTLGVAPPDGFFPPLRPGVTNSVPPGPHAGNTDLREMGGRLDHVHSGVEAGGAHLHRRLARRAGRRRNQPECAGDPHAGAAHPGHSPQAEEFRLAHRRNGDVLDTARIGQGPERSHDAGGAQRHRLSGHARQA